MSDVLPVNEFRGTHGFAPPNRAVPVIPAHPGTQAYPRAYTNGSANGPIPMRPVEAPPVISVAVGTTLADMEKRLIMATLEQHGGNKRRAAQVLGVSVRTIYNRLRDYRLSGR